MCSIVCAGQPLARKPLLKDFVCNAFLAVELRSRGDVAQLGERGVRNAEVEGSIPFVSTNLL
jgi:hypothetical protein